MVKKLASSIYNDVMTGLIGITSTPNMSIEQLEDEIIDERLTIIKELVQKHKELIWAESEIGKGSRFIVTMPKITKKDEETI